MRDDTRYRDASRSDWPIGGSDALLEALQADYLPDLGHVDMGGLLTDPRLGRVALVSSFGAESAVLLHYVTRVFPDIPVLFIDTGCHFPETLAYRDDLAARLNLNLVNLRPDAALIAEEDPTGDLPRRDPNMCCTLRKTFPLADALEGYETWISGRKRYQGQTRAALPALERDGTHIKVNPLVFWSPQEISEYFKLHDLPRHPLVDRGYVSIGCAPCTRPVKQGEDIRAGRWADNPDKTECGIHLGPDGRFVRGRGR
ncbi:phosphoadenylyl-sulfate reductase [Rhodovulum adriaticum]|uniref:Adenosine 5'-phosphosulfate reductase n=1 Tax=Rhodovulum adriaticum TaxID=35804 RepID=A0A4R2NIU4_RHOAD|nr:phosphoadenylyl-sulfate reductase [Rhodovulum adriaticum]MBK1636620.1 phosphoadenosine phosphosulfate reductase [Rhodovulum adriaticum]TCP21357.1 phosphoadenylylsulfate reductase (thioredoxin) [Rhodovulum adriaticum]